MAITQSAKKALRNSNRKRVFNMRRNRALTSVVKEIRILAASKDAKSAQAMLTTAYQAIDKAAKTHYISKNTAARKKSRLAALLKRMA